jgi:hypothetical protein
MADSEQVTFRPAPGKDVDTLRRWYRWKSPFTEDLPLLERSLRICFPDAFKIIEELNILCGRKVELKGDEEGKETKDYDGYSRFFVLASRVKQKAIAYFKEQKEKVSMQVLPPVKVPPAPHSTPYRGDFPPLALRMDMKSANYSVTQFLGMVEEGLEYESFVRGLVKEAREEEPWLLDARDVERGTKLIVQAKQLRQTMIGEAFRGSLNKIVTQVNHNALSLLLKSDLWKTHLSSLLTIDCIKNDEVVFVPTQKGGDREALISLLRPCADQMTEFYQNLTLELKGGEQRKMCPVRVELFSLTKIETVFPSHPGLLEGSFGLVDEVLWCGGAKESPPEGNKKKLMNIPPELYLMFYKRSLGLKFEEKDYYFQHNGMTCRIVSDVFGDHLEKE